MEFDRSLLTFNPKNHGHYYNGQRLLGVTTALGIISKGDALVQWSANQAVEYLRLNLVGEITAEELDKQFSNAKRHWRDVKQEAADIGTLAHNWIERHLRGEAPNLLPENEYAKRSCEAAVKWIELHRWRTVSIEQQVYLPKLGVAGICDWYAEIDGELAVPDWKTSKDVYSIYRYQTAAYLKAIEEETGERVKNRWILRIDKLTGEFHDVLLPRKDLAADFRAFKNAVALYKRERELQKVDWNVKATI